MITEPERTTPQTSNAKQNDSRRCSQIILKYLSLAKQRELACAGALKHQSEMLPMTLLEVMSKTKSPTIHIFQYFNLRISITVVQLTIFKKFRSLIEYEVRMLFM